MTCDVSSRSQRRTFSPSVVATLFWCLPTLSSCENITAQKIQDGPLFQVPFMAGAFDFSASGAVNVQDTFVGNCVSKDFPVNVQYTKDPKCIRNGLECNIGWTEPGDWFEYAFESEHDDVVVVSIRVASNREGRLFSLEIIHDDDSNNSTNSTNNTDTNTDNDRPFLEYAASGVGWQTFTEIVWSPVSIRAGRSRIILRFVTGFINFCSLSMWSELEFPLKASAALDYSGYRDSTPEVNLGDCRPSSPVDAQFTTDQGCIDRGSVCNIGWTEPNEYVDYIFYTGADTEYVDITVRVASLVKNQKFLLTFKPDTEEEDFLLSEATFTAPAKGWQSFEDRVWKNLPSNSGGQHILRVTFLTGNVNLCSVSVTEADVQRVDGPFSVLQVPFQTSALAYNKFVEYSSKQLGNCGDGPVDAEFTSDQVCKNRGSDCNIAWTQPGEALWYFMEGSLDRDILVDITVRVASKRSTKRFTLEMEQLHLNRTWNAPGKGLQSFQDYVWKGVLLPAGRYHVVVKFDTGGVNFCSISAKEA